jgi:hypothetical protein
MTPTLNPKHVAIPNLTWPLPRQPKPLTKIKTRSQISNPEARAELGIGEPSAYHHGSMSARARRGGGEEIAVPGDGQEEEAAAATARKAHGSRRGAEEEEATATERERGELVPWLSALS